MCVVVLLDGVALVEVQADRGLVVGWGASVVSGDLLLEVVHVGVDVLLLWYGKREEMGRGKVNCSEFGMEHCIAL